MKTLHYQGRWFSYNDADKSDIAWIETTSLPKDQLRDIVMEDDLRLLAECSRVECHQWSHVTVLLGLAVLKRIICHGLNMEGYHHNDRVYLCRNDQWVEDTSGAINRGILTRDILEDVLVNVDHFV